MKSVRAPWALRGIGAFVAIAFAFPAAYLVWRSITSDADPLGLLTSERTLAPLWRTAKLSVLVSVAAALIGTTLAWLVVRTDLPARRFWRALLPVPLVFPSFIGAAAFIRTLNPGGLANGWFEAIGLGPFELRGLTGAWLVLTLFTYPYVFLPVAARLQRLPGSLEESARVLGDKPGRVFRRIVFPQIRGSVAAGTLLVFLYTISDFGAVQLMRYDTLTRAIETNYLARPAVALALSLILLAVALTVVGAERTFVDGEGESESPRSSYPLRHPLNRLRWPSLGATIFVAALAIGAPSIAIADWAADGLLRSSRDGRSLTVRRETIIEAAGNTLESSLLAASVAVLAVLPIAFLVGRFKDRIGTASHGVVIATFALPGILIALALRFWTFRSGFAGDLLSDTKALLIFGYAIRFGSLALGVTVIAVQAVPQRFHDVAASLGADRWRRLRTIDLPLMMPGLLAAFGLVLLSTMKELPITLIIAPLGYPTLTTRIFGSFEDAFVAEAGIMAAVLVVMSATLSWFLVLRRADQV